MPAPVSKLHHRATVEVDTIADILAALSSGLRSGTLGLRLADDRLQLDASDRIELDFKAQHKDEESTVSIRMRWKNGEPRNDEPLRVFARGERTPRDSAQTEGDATPASSATPGKSKGSTSKRRSSSAKTSKTSKTTRASDSKSKGSGKKKTTSGRTKRS